MNIDIYKVIISRYGYFHDHFRFAGRRPTKAELIEAIDRRGDSTAEHIAREAHVSRTIVQEIGVPKNTQASVTWEILNREVAKVRVEHETAWKEEELKQTGTDAPK